MMQKGCKTTWSALAVLSLAATLFGCVETGPLPDDVVNFLHKSSTHAGCRGCASVEGEEPVEGEELDSLVVTLPGNVPLVLVPISAGAYMRGAYPGEKDAVIAREEPQHQVTLTQDFHLGKYPVSKRQWYSLMDTTPWSRLLYVLDNPDSPAVGVSWDEAQEFVAALNIHITNTRQGPANFRLPAEAQWEYACRADTTTRFYWGDDLEYTQIDIHAWYRNNTRDLGNRHAHEVGLKLQNAWGLFDMSGNIYEWCQDWYDTYPAESVTDPQGPASGTSRVLRGGSFEERPDRCRSAYRNLSPQTFRSASVGFRLCRL